MLFCSLISFGQAGFFPSGGGVIRLSHNASADFNTQEWNVNYGSTHSLWLKGGYAHTFKGANGNICEVTLHYRVFKDGETPGAFSYLNLGFDSGNPYTTNAVGGDVSGNNLGDQRWGRDDQNINISELATSNGTWVLEVFFSATGNNSSSSGCGDPFFYTNSGSNYQVFFNMVDHYYAFASAINLKTCESPDFPYAFYNTSGDVINQISTVNFENQNFGSFFQDSGDFRLQGGELKTFKEDYANVCTSVLRYRIYEESNPSGSFSPINIDPLEDCNGCPGAFPSGGPCNGLGTCNDQKWQTTGLNANIDLTSFPPGNYVLEIYLEVLGNNSNTSGCSDIRYINNGGANFKATFTIIPPTSEITSNP